MDKQSTEIFNRILNEQSYYPDMERKSITERETDLLDWYEKYNEVNEFYNVWGLDLISSEDPSIYLDHGIFRKQRYSINSTFICTGDEFPTNYTVVMRDKSLFEMFAANILGDTTKYVKSYALIKGNLFLPLGNVGARQETFLQFVEKHNGEKLVFKRTTGCSGMSVYVTSINEGKIIHRGISYFPSEFLEKITDMAATWMIQPFVKQHPFMDTLNSETVNIIRIVTFNTGMHTFTTPATLVYARQGAEVCNSDQGSYYVGINKNGVIAKKAVDRLESRFVNCPAAGKKLPFFNELIDLVCALHTAIPELFTIGWDVALTESGPLVLEGNDGWCPYVNELSADTALRETWDKAVLERKNYYGL